jgi:methylmalonyl-CoA/ethylmalonyl-CoA epimerase
VFGRIDHVGVAVTDLDAAVSLYEGSFGMTLAHRETIRDQGVRAVLMDVGSNHLELLEPLDADTPVGRFIDRRGAGLHHVAYRVSDIDSTLRALRDAGLRLIDETPRTGIRHSRVAFLHPAATGGVLSELVEPAEEVRA